MYLLPHRTNFDASSLSALTTHAIDVTFPTNPGGPQSFHSKLGIWSILTEPHALKTDKLHTARLLLTLFTRRMPIASLAFIRSSGADAVVTGASQWSIRHYPQQTA
jgi:hypothetical protein